MKLAEDKTDKFRADRKLLLKSCIQILKAAVIW